MAKLTMREASATERAAGAPPISLGHSTPLPPSMGQQLAPLPTGDTLDSVRQEIADANSDAQSFYNREPDEVFRLVSGHHARLSALRTVVGMFDGHPTWRRVKVELEDTMKSLREQFEYHSRIVSSRELDWKIETGGRQT